MAARASAPFGMSLKQTQQIGRYHVMDRIAYGGMAEIFRAKTYDHEGSERIVVIKKVLAHLAEDDEFIDMLVDEAKIAGTLEHPNIAQVFEFGQVEDGYFIAMEYVDGKDVRSLLDKCRTERRRLSVENCVYIMSQALRGLHAAHAATDAEGKPYSIVHRDVSPSNVLCGYNGEVKLIDFGIAKARMSRVRTKTGVIKGKVKYMSPEQAMGKELDPRSDVFSAGSVLYEMLTKVPPFQAPSEMDLIFRVREAEFTPPSKRNPRVPKELEKILTRAMARSRSRRYRSAAEFADDLTAFLYAVRPDYEPSEIARFLKRLYADEIERELRTLEEYVVGDASRQNVGVNLIADALPQNAPYKEFSPVPGPHEAATVIFDSERLPGLGLGMGQPGADGLPPQPPPDRGSGDPEDRSIHSRPTMILTADDLARMRPSRARTIHEEKTLAPSDRGAAAAAGALAGNAPQFPAVPRGLQALGPPAFSGVGGGGGVRAARPPGTPGPVISGRRISAEELQALPTRIGATPVADVVAALEEDDGPTTPQRRELVAGALFGKSGALRVDPTGGAAARSSPGPGNAAPPRAVDGSASIKSTLNRAAGARAGGSARPGAERPDAPRVRLVTPVINLDDQLDELEVTDGEAESLELADDDLVEEDGADE
jgi:serine/threonine protein kinase